MGDYTTLSNTLRELNALPCSNESTRNQLRSIAIEEHIATQQPKNSLQRRLATIRLMDQLKKDSLLPSRYVERKCEAAMTESSMTEAHVAQGVGLSRDLAVQMPSSKGRPTAVKLKETLSPHGRFSGVQCTRVSLLLVIFFSVINIALFFPPSVLFKGMNVVPPSHPFGYQSEYTNSSSMEIEASAWAGKSNENPVSGERLSTSNEVHSFNKKSNESPKKTYAPPSCVFNDDQNRRVDRIYFLHMRKAGGTSLRSYFQQVARQHGVDFVAAEGYKFPEQAVKNGTTLYITHVREPISRAISHYKYELRWRCADLQQPGFVPLSNNTRMSLSAFAKKDHGARNRVWTCSSNCYTRWVIGHRKYLDMRTDNDALLSQVAHEMLWSYNFILVVEWLRDEDYVRSIERIFGVQNLNRKVGMHCQKPSRAANSKVPLVVEKSDIWELHKVNRIDVELYKNLTTCKPSLSGWKINWRKKNDTDRGLW